MGTFYFEKEKSFKTTLLIRITAHKQNKNGSLDMYNAFNNFELCE